MSGLDTNRLVLIRSTCKNNAGEEIYYHGTGYFVTKDLVLTAGHVLAAAPSEVKVRLEAPPDGEPWRKADPVPVWLNQELDVALLKIVERPIHEVNPPLWGRASFAQNANWDSTAYPLAAVEKTDDGKTYKSAGLKGILYARGGGGQGLPNLELGVDHESSNQWNGISGAPIFVDEELVGIITSYKKGFNGKRLDGVPIRQLLNDPTFQRALTPKWLPPLPQHLWTLILISENNDEDFLDKAKRAIERRGEVINRVAGLPPDAEPQFIEISIIEALREPTRWYDTVEAICAAPILVVDVTKYQPAVMILLGIRAVVRRGVTITVTSAELDESLLSELPFNIQETKLIYPRPDLEVTHPHHPINRIGEAIVKGLVQLRGHSGYLDLPAYEAVRYPKPQVISAEPEGQAGDVKATGPQSSTLRKVEPERILMLCSFSNQYRKHWLYVSEKITLNFKGAGKSLERMLDISSPRLVGQALYENIRWAPCCIVDWTRWSPNVFFELGVRLACSDIGPVCLIAEEDLAAATEDFQVQKGQLLKLFCPISYKVGGSSAPFKAAFGRYNSFLKDGQEDRDFNSTLPHNATHRTVVKAYDWRQEAFARPPHEELRANIEEQQGKDPEKDGFQTLFSSNAEFQLEIQRSGRERWIAAWYYFRKRYTPDNLESEEFKNNREIREQLSTLTERVVQELRNQPDPSHQRIYKEAVDLIDQLDEL